ncbi:terminase large subunit [Romboutsia sp.]|uniref:terminase large subunit n=1 Tax=Romboutsia sp. TaxID=1965302 RepID=UPI003F40C75D
MEQQDLIGLEWAKQVLRGEFKANKYIILECARYVKRIDDEYVDDNEGSYYYFDFDEVEYIYDLLSLINYSTGFYTGEPIINHIAGFQAMILENLFGWIHIDNGKRLITDAVLLIGRKSGKSFLCALLEILLMLTGEKFQQHAVGAKTRDISAIVKRETEQLIKANPILLKRFKVQRDKIICKSNESFMRNLSGESNNVNGLLLTSYIVDEVANMKDHEVIGALRLSQMSTKQRLGIHISTAYNLEINAMRDLCDLHKKNLDGITDDIHSFGLIFELDEGDDYTDESNWVKASPLQMNLEDGISFMRSEFKKGLEVPEKMKEFRIKLLNQWISTQDGEQYVALDDFRKCRILEYDWYGKDVYIGLDLAVSDDNVSFVMATHDTTLGKNVYKPFVVVPSDKISDKMKNEKVDYQMMIEQGLCYSCGDKKIDDEFVVQKVIQLQDEYGVNIKHIGYDPAFSKYVAKRLDEEGFAIMEVYQSASNLHLCTKGFKDDVLEGKFAYEKNKLYEENIVNTKEVRDANLKTKLEKKKSRGKIDMVVASTFAKCMIQVHEEEDNEINVFIL